ncbi:hypothetical protein C922_05357 [Plasmodium inui San Antonio 1]|uniref:Pv-fam-d protein n=1 Tax=Plasmodium inui San Antonio 1 TaxID=1237626 RepID=W6ZYA2_9APIC|nr:hypothetical protein C922_05357 [Plasmodium inui San Antonio 1]EUD64270.1 hypothetical protein C922_05357 [Plasmodium inui San Antonio 1]
MRYSIELSTNTLDKFLVQSWRNLKERKNGRRYISSRCLVGHTTLLNAQEQNCNSKRHRRVRQEDHDSPHPEENYNIASADSINHKPVPNQKVGSPRICGPNGISPSHLRKAPDSDRWRNRLKSGRMDTKAGNLYGADDFDNFLKEPEDDYYRGGQKFRCPSEDTRNHTRMDKGLLPVQEGHDLKPEAIKSGSRRRSEDIPEVLEYYDSSYRSRSFEGRIKDLIDRVNVRFQLELMRHIRDKEYSVESEFLEIRSGGRKIAYYYRKYRVLLPLIISTVALLISLLGLYASSLGSVWITTSIMISGLFLSTLYYYIKTYCKIGKMRRCFKKHGVIINP